MQQPQTVLHSSRLPGPEKTRCLRSMKSLSIMQCGMKYVGNEIVTLQ